MFCNTSRRTDAPDKVFRPFRPTLSRVYEPAREYHDFIYTQLNEAAAAPAMEFRGDFP